MSQTDKICEVELSYESFKLPALPAPALSTPPPPMSFEICVIIFFFLFCQLTSSFMFLALPPSLSTPEPNTKLNSHWRSLVAIETHMPTMGRLETLGSDSSTSSNFRVWSIVRYLWRRTDTTQSLLAITEKQNQDPQLLV